MMNRRKLVNLGLCGSVSAILASSAVRAASSKGSKGSSGSGSALRPVLTPFLDRLPLPPPPFRPC